MQLPSSAFGENGVFYTDSLPSHIQSDDPMNLEGFDILEQLGHGGMATVYRARQISLDREVAIKVFAPRFEPTPEDREQFQHEARIAARLKHPGLVQVYDAIFTNEMYCFVMELVQGYTVGSWSDRKGHLEERQVLDIADCVAAALDYAWTQHGVIHCDIKPDNLMVDADGTVKILDLGLCKTAQAIMQQSEADDQVYGTPQYLSPEQAIGQSDLDCRTDIYALGATLYHLATGQLLFPGYSDAEAMDMQVRAKAPNPGAVNPELSPAFCSLLEKMLCKDRDHRQPDWHTVRTDIEAVRLGLPLPSGNPVPGAATVESAPPPEAPGAKTRGKTVVRPRIPARKQPKVAIQIKAADSALPQPSENGLPPPPASRSKTPLVLTLSAVAVVALVAALILSGNAQKKKRAEARQAAITEARTALNALDDVRPDVQAIDKAMELFKQVRADFPELSEEASTALDNLRARREAAEAYRIRTKIETMRNEANALARAGDYDKAISRLLDYRGEGSEEFASDLRKAADAILEERKRHEEDVARQEEETRRQREAAAAAEQSASQAADIANQLLDAFETSGIGYANSLLDELEQRLPDAFAKPGDCAMLRDIFRGARSAQERFDTAFKPDTAMSLDLRNGTSLRGRLIRVNRATDELVFATQVNGIDLNRTISFKELTPREILFRLGNDQDPGTRFVRVNLFRRFDLPVPSPTFLEDQCEGFPERIRKAALAH